jgi:hypothetical protein
MNNMEVTLMISIASSGFVIPFEKMKKSGKNNPLNSEYSRIRDNSFVSKFSNDKELNSSWRVSKTVSFNKDNWEGINNCSEMGEEYKVSLILPILRNALAHGKILVKGNKDHIEEIFFISKPENNQSVIKKEDNNHCAVIVSPEAFRFFLYKWFDFISELDFKLEEVKEDIEES